MSHTLTIAIYPLQVGSPLPPDQGHGGARFPSFPPVTSRALVEFHSLSYLVVRRRG
jgi:hypothetical protein